MTTKPKVRKFRIRRSSPLAAEQEQSSVEEPRGTAQAIRKVVEQAENGSAGTPQPTPAEDARLSDTAEVAGDTDMAVIRQEGLTGRQLRMARRLAQKHGLAPTSDFDAVRQLRARGIDPFERANMLELVVPAQGSSGPQGGRVQLPQTTQPIKPPSTELAPPPPPPDPRAGRIREIQDIQRDISRRRRRKMVLLVTRLMFLVALPTLIAGYYYHVIATPMYATNSEFVIQQADPASPGALGGLFSGTGFATSQDSIAVQSYLQSRDAMLRLDKDLGFKTHFSDPSIDAIQRLPADATNEQAYKVFKNNVEIGYDPSEGIIKMEVVAPDPEVSAQWSRQLIGYAEQQVDNLTRRLRSDQMEGAEQSYADAEAKMTAAQDRVLQLQEELGVFDPRAESGGVMSQITTFEVQLQQKRLELQQLLDNRRPNQPRVDGVQGDITRLEQLIARLRGQLTDDSGGANSLARVSGQLRMAEVDLQTRTAMMQQALQQLETSRIEVNRQTRYLSMGVTPIPPDEATYPRAFEDTLLAFLIFSGIYLMVSLTASILREQVSG